MNPRLVKFLAASVIFLNVVSPITQAKAVFNKNEKLKFKNDGKFKIVQFTDTQDGPNTDPRTIKLMNNILDKEKPDLVVLTGDNIDGKCKTREDVKKAIDNIAQPMETRNIPWAIVFGNHDEEHKVMTKEEMMKLYMSYPHNISSIGPKNVDGVGNYNLLINGSKSNKPAFNVYMMDSGSYTTTGIGYYDWIKFSQIQWYRSTTEELKAKYKKTVPALMFFHIPLQEFKMVWNSGKAVGAKNEEECPAAVNSGLFASLLDEGDVKGVFVGHDHINDYVGELGGIKLGYSRNVGYGTYGLDGFARGGRVFELNEANPEQFTTRMVLATDFN